MSVPCPVGIVQIISLICDSRRIVSVHLVFLVSGHNDGLKHEAKICK